LLHFPHAKIPKNKLNIFSLFFGVLVWDKYNEILLNGYRYHLTPLTGWSKAAVKAILHGVSRAGIAKVQGNKTSSAFWSGFVSSGFSIGNKGYGGIANRTAIMAIVGGTTSAVSGGKFANGAVTGAFVHLFNAEHIIGGWKEFRVLKAEYSTKPGLSGTPSMATIVWTRKATVVQYRENYRYCENDCTQQPISYDFRVTDTTDVRVMNYPTMNLNINNSPKSGRFFVAINPWTGEAHPGRVK
jgi:hypothetical protein